jgi:hypothetical protein
VGPKMDLTRYDGHRASASTTLRILRHRGLLQPAGYTRERRQLAAARRAAPSLPSRRSWPSPTFSWRSSPLAWRPSWTSGQALSAVRDTHRTFCITRLTDCMWFMWH